MVCFIKPSSDREIKVATFYMNCFKLTYLDILVDQNLKVPWYAFYWF